ncbi:hypothetical protein [Sphingosinicella sp. BN140058]|uniref:hypothetical protein n=1 Tax=Sphingosinicella sp. BN140058 TaxID=1892855 RepID=UPI0010113C85|nr:hypothetical protein [Sphingosinicella sp. BN140058]QAY80436.1 hypothetical protein ETR14_27745 [Sphingosinicella sp. BN140058]
MRWRTANNRRKPRYVCLGGNYVLKSRTRGVIWSDPTTTASHQIAPGAQDAPRSSQPDLAECGFCGDATDINADDTERTWQQWQCGGCSSWNDRQLKPLAIGSAAA